MSGPKRTVVWVTKYALTKGIYKVEAERVGDRMVRVNGSNGSFAYYLHDGQWHLTYAQARQRAFEMIEAAERSLEKRRKKLEALREELSRETPHE